MPPKITQPTVSAEYSLSYRADVAMHYAPQPLSVIGRAQMNNKTDRTSAIHRHSATLPPITPIAAGSNEKTGNVNGLYAVV